MQILSFVDSRGPLGCFCKEESLTRIQAWVYDEGRAHRKELTRELCRQRICFGAFSVASSTTHVKFIVLPALIKSSDRFSLRPSIWVTGSKKGNKKNHKSVSWKFDLLSEWSMHSFIFNWDMKKTETTDF